MGLVRRFFANQFVDQSFVINSRVIKGVGGSLFLFALCSAMAFASSDESQDKFTDVTKAAGFDYEQTTPGALLGYEYAYMSGGVAAADFDNDGWVDLYVTKYDGYDILYRNRGDGTFEDYSRRAGILRRKFSNGAGWADIDNDGDPDLFVTVFSQKKTRSFLYINRGNGTFREEGVQRGATRPIFEGNSVGFADYDRDGWLDIHVSEYHLGPAYSHLLRNKGSESPGYFSDVTKESGLDLSEVWAFTGSWVDFNNDLWPDFALAGDFSTSRLFWNNGDGTFTEGTKAAGVGTDQYGMGAAIADVNSDGYFDWFVSSIHATKVPDTKSPFLKATGNRLYINNGDMTFSDQSEQLAIRDGGWGWGSVLFDYDNDGDLDLLLANGMAVPDVYLVGGYSGYHNDATRFWRNDDGRFVEVSAQLGLNAKGLGKGLASFDYDHDGDLDIFVVNNSGQPRLYRNDTRNNNHWLRLKLVGSVSNVDAVGATVTVTYGDKHQKAQVSASGNYLGQHESIVHFGLARDVSDSVVDVIEVVWPSGHVQIVENLSVDQVHRIIEPDEEPDNDGDGVWNMHDNCPSVANVQQDNNDGDMLGDVCDEDDDNDGLADVVETATGHFVSLADTGTDPFVSDSDNDGLSDSAEDNSAVFESEDNPGTDPNKSDTDGDGLLDHDEVNFFHLNPLVPDKQKFFSVARYWNEELMDAIRTDYPAPTVHSRNLFHLSAAMWDAWAAYDATANGYFVKEKHNAKDVAVARREAISYAAYRLLVSRFPHSPGAKMALASFNHRMDLLGYNPNIKTTVGDTPAALGNRIAEKIIKFGLSDGSNEATMYSDPRYKPVNDVMTVKLPGTKLKHKNRWQPLALDFIIAQNGIPLPGKVQTFLGSHWGRVVPFALSRQQPTDVYNDPGPPPLLGADIEGDLAFKKAINRVIRFSSLLTPDDGVMIDISPGKIGNNTLATNDGLGHAVNPSSAKPYAENVVLRGDFMRTIAEFWADGPDSETPPGHWNTLANYVSDHPATVKRYKGEGPVLDELEWDVKLYFAINGATSDAAISAWDAKAKYDYVRPISAIRYMGEKGQSSEPEDTASYHPDGLLLEAGLVEVISAASTAAGQRHAHLAGHEGEIAIRAWPGNPQDPHTQYGGVQWVLATTWIPYQRDTFVTPPFAGYTSGHSAFSRAGAEVLTAFTGDKYFPGGMGTFHSKKAEYLEFEFGPSEDVHLQWATYYDAADQAGVSRLAGGIHVDADDLKGRIMGAKAGIGAWKRVQTYFTGTAH